MHHLNNQIRRIGFIGGPGSGKSTAAAMLFSKLKLEGYSIELVNEYAKRWAYEHRQIKKYDQILFLGKQCQYEYNALKGGSKYIITDSPLFLTYVYTQLASKGDSQLLDGVKKIILEFEQDFPAVYFFLKRNAKLYVSVGRYQTYEEAVRLDNLIKENFYEIFSNDKQFIEIDYNSYDEMLDNCKQYLNK